MTLKQESYIGKFKVEGLKGAGVFGRVYTARDPDMDRLVAIKVPNDNSMFNPQAFRREAKIIGALEHPHIVKIHQIDQLELSNGDPAWHIVMAFAEGGSLGDRIRGGRHFSPKETVPIIRQVADAMASVHAKGLFHRDIKPHNILLSAKGEPWLADFGLILPRKTAETHGIKRETQYTVKDNEYGGSPAYMSPEYRKEKKIGKRADIWSLGMTAYEMLTGKLYMWDNDEPQNSPPPRLRDKNPDVSETLEKIVQRMLAIDIEERFGTMEEVCEAFSRPGIADPARDPKPDNKERKQAGGWKRPLVFLAAAGVIAAAVFGYMATDALRTPDQLPELTFGPREEPAQGAAANSGTARTDPPAAAAPAKGHQKPSTSNPAGDTGRWAKTAAEKMAAANRLIKRADNNNQDPDMYRKALPILKEAQDTAEKGRRYETAAEAAYQQAYIQSMVFRDEDKALAIYEKLIEQYPGTVGAGKAHLQAGQIHSDRGSLNQAEWHFATLAANYHSQSKLKVTRTQAGFFLDNVRKRK